VEVAKASKDHLEVINRIILAAKRHWGYSEDLINVWKPELLMTPESFASKDVWLLAKNSKTIGVASISIISSQNFELEDCWLAPEYIGKGAGRFLFEFIINWLHKNNAVTLKIVADPNAAGFYEKMGANFVGMVPTKPKGRELPEFLYSFQ